MPKRTHALILCSALSTPLITSAAGFGQVNTVAVMGQPLVMNVPIRLDSGTRMASDCVSAEVQSGDSKLPANQVRVQVLTGPTDVDWVARITTVGPIEEPVLVVSVSAGCEQRFVRRFTAFADAPLSLAAVKGDRGSAVAPFASSQAVVTGGIDDLMLSPSPTSRPARHPTSSVARAKSSDLTPSRLSRAPSKGKMVSAPGASAASLALPAEAQVARLLLDVGGPRLKMDMEDPIMRVADGRVASSADAGLSVLGDEEAGRLALLERSLLALRTESHANQAAAAALKTQLQDAQSRARLLPWLLALLALTGGLALWLALRLRKKARETTAGGAWWSSQSATLDPAGPVPVPPISVVGDLHEDAVDSVNDVDLGGDSGNDWVGVDALPTAPMAAPKPAFNAAATAVIESNSPAREVSVEELMDLEQQADFFIALGEEDAAVDLLMSHLRSTGGQSPLPYTKLLEIYRRQGDRGAYERIRARFNRRFNAYAPDWDAGPLQGRSLEDYPALITQLQALWESPIDAMAVLESMLFRKDDNADMFDLPAYKDVLLLYALARDLWQQGGMGVTEVDLLLPLGDANPTAIDLPLMDNAAQFDYDLTSFQLEPPSAAPTNPDEPATGRSQLS